MTTRTLAPRNDRFYAPTAKQVDFFKSLIEGRVLPASWDADRMVAAVEAGTVDARKVSAAIDSMKGFPRKPGTGRFPALPDVPEGHYAVESRTGNNDLDFFRVDRPTQGQWAGRTFVKRVIGGRPDSPVRGQEARQALEAIVAAGVEQAGLLYASELGRCYHCSRILTDDESRERGLGPICAGLR